MWQRGYVTERIRQKCLENGILFVEVFGKDIGKECSACGGKDFTLKEGLYICGRCALEIDSRRNAAINELRRGERIIPEP
ncbi:MAG: transposase [Lachnospiraceae bacterium]|nr:transposase [Lachnospiraceae bacterium]